MTERLYPDIVSVMTEYIQTHQFFALRNIATAYYQQKYPNKYNPNELAQIRKYIRSMSRHISGFLNTDQIRKYNRWAYESLIFTNGKKKNEYSK